MARLLAALLSFATVFAGVPDARPSSFVIAPIRVPVGTVLAFHFHTRLHQTGADPLDLLPPGTVLHVRILDSIDSGVDRDGSEFQGSVVSDLSVGSNVLIHSEAKVQGLLVLLRSRNHPDGFRFELLLTQLTDHGKSYPLSASLNSSFFDSGSRPASTASSEARQSQNPAAASNARIPAGTHN